ncbi:MAG: PilW family protein [Pseudomonadota bacterium]
MKNTVFSSQTSRGSQAGLTLVEFMVSIVIGMLLIAALATLIANQSSTRAEIDKSGRMIENGRYAVGVIANDAQGAGYWGELTTQPAVPAAVPDPCSTNLADLQAAFGVPIQGYDSLTAAALAPSCVGTTYKVGTDILVVRRLDPDMSSVQDAGGDIDLSKLTSQAGQVFMQTGLDATGTVLTFSLGYASATSATNATTFSLKKKVAAKIANVRKYMVHIYFVSQCSVPVAGSCTGADGGTPIPTLKRVELSTASGAPAFTTVTIAEGIENFQVDYGVDTDSDGSPNIDSNGTACTTGDATCTAAVVAAKLVVPFGANDWANVTAVKMHLLARSGEKVIGFADTKTYAFGTAGSASAPTGDESYKRHMFVQAVRVVNPAIRRAL